MQRGAVPPLIAMLGQGDVQLKEMGAFALGRLAQNADNQAGIVQASPLLRNVKADTSIYFKAESCTPSRRSGLAAVEVCRELFPRVRYCVMGGSMGFRVLFTIESSMVFLPSAMYRALDAEFHPPPRRQGATVSLTWRAGCRAEA